MAQIRVQKRGGFRGTQHAICCVHRKTSTPESGGSSAEPTKKGQNMYHFWLALFWGVFDLFVPFVRQKSVGWPKKGVGFGCSSVHPRTLHPEPGVSSAESTKTVPNMYHFGMNRHDHCTPPGTVPYCPPPPDPKCLRPPQLRR